MPACGGVQGPRSTDKQLWYDIEARELIIAGANVDARLPFQGVVMSSRNRLRNV